jgi:hypothetical protein
MSLQSYEAIYHQGQIKWIGDCPQVEEARIAGKGKVLGDIIAPATSVDDWNCTK